MKCLPLTTAEAKPVAAKMASSAAPIPVLKLKRDTDINRMNHSEAGEDLFGGSDAGRENRGHLEGRRASGKRVRRKFDPNSWTNSIPTVRTNVLCLGVSYPCVARQLRAEKVSKSALGFPDAGVEQVVELVRRNILTQMDGRDLARCLSLEAGNDTIAYCVSMEKGSQYGKRHLHANFNNAKCCENMRKVWGPKVRFRQIILDYYWIPRGSWSLEHWKPTLFDTTLPNFVTMGMLDFSTGVPDGKRNSHLFAHSTAGSGGGVVYLPFCFHCVKEVVAAIVTLSKYYVISFLSKSDLREHALWSATNIIDPVTMQNWFGKAIDQEEVYCTFTSQEVYSAADEAHVRKDDVLKVLRGIEDFKNVRMIKLKALEKYNPYYKGEWDGNVFGVHKGGFKGLVNPDDVVRGFDEGRKTKKKKEERKRKIATLDASLDDSTSGRGSRQYNQSKKMVKVAKKGKAEEYPIIHRVGDEGAPAAAAQDPFFSVEKAPKKEKEYQGKKKKENQKKKKLTKISAAGGKARSRREEGVDERVGLPSNPSCAGHYSGMARQEKKEIQKHKKRAKISSCGEKPQSRREVEFDNSNGFSSNPSFSSGSSGLTQHQEQINSLQADENVSRYVVTPSPTAQEAVIASPGSNICFRVVVHASADKFQSPCLEKSNNSQLCSLQTLASGQGTKLSPVEDTMRQRLWPKRQSTQERGRFSSTGKKEKRQKPTKQISNRFERNLGGSPSPESDIRFCRLKGVDIKPPAAPNSIQRRELKFHGTLRKLLEHKKKTGTLYVRSTENATLYKFVQDTRAMFGLWQQGWKLVDFPDGWGETLKKINFFEETGDRPPRNKVSAKKRKRIAEKKEYIISPIPIKSSPVCAFV